MTNLAVPIAGAIAVAFAGLMAFQRSLYSAAICLLVVLLQTAAFFFLSGAPLLAFLQIMIYAGAIMVMVIITIMAAPAPAERRSPSLWAGPVLTGALGLAFAGMVLALVRRGSLPAGGLGAGLTVQTALGPVLFGPYAPATEAVTLLMLLASLALVSRAKRQGAGGTR